MIDRLPDVVDASGSSPRRADAECPRADSPDARSRTVAVAERTDSAEVGSPKWDASVHLGTAVLPLPCRAPDPAAGAADPPGEVP